MKFIFIMIVLFSSCKGNEAVKTVYSFDGVNVTRIDKFRVSNFYYGNFDENDPDTTIGHIKASYPLGSNIMDGYLIFKPNKKVVLVEMTSNFVQVKPDSLFSTFRFKENLDFIRWEDSVKKNFDNLIRFSENIQLEDRLKKQFGSKVQIIRMAQE